MKGILIASGIAAAISCASVQAAAISFDLLQGTTYGKYYSSLSYEVSGLDLTVTAFSDTGGLFDNRIRTAGIGAWNGLGVCNRDEVVGSSCYSPAHSIDNSADSFLGWADYDMLLLSFSSEVSLSGISLGWIGTDSDMSVLGFNGGQFSGFSSADTYSDLGASGWSLVGQYANVSNTAINAQNFVASTWLIGAYNPAFGSAGFSTGNDQFKIDGLQVTVADTGEEPNPVPVSGTLALFSIGMAALGMRRLFGRGKSAQQI
ncbi:exosortase-dependent surface protein XDP1 [Allohahella marinimesophila]|uniref:PEP-CTERM protein-sorting domain-containing protein n=1 Tax=Allohahella marinimesophila TaxID=1054972 RepID=A0ABP7PDZ4_9GAMM